MLAIERQHPQHTACCHRRKPFDGIEPGRCKRAIRRVQAAGGEHQQRNHCHGLGDDLYRLQAVKIFPVPHRGNLRTDAAGQRQQPQTNGQHPATIDPAQIAQRNDQWQRNQLRQGHQQHHRRGFEGAIALHLSEVTGRNLDHCQQHKQHPAQRQQCMGKIADFQQLQLEKRQRMGPLIDKEQHHQGRAGDDKKTDHRRLEPVQALTQLQRQYQHDQPRQTQEQAAPVKLLETLQTQRVLRQAPGHAGHRQQAQGDDLPERPLPPGVLHPPGR